MALRTLLCLLLFGCLVIASCGGDSTPSTTGSADASSGAGGVSSGGAGGSTGGMSGGSGLAGGAADDAPGGADDVSSDAATDTDRADAADGRNDDRSSDAQTDTGRADPANNADCHLGRSTDCCTDPPRCTPATCLLMANGVLRCTPCGESSPLQPCCPGRACGGNGCCVGTTCYTNGSSCTSANLGTCSDGRCVGCGTLGGPCCPARWDVPGSIRCTDPNTVCHYNIDSAPEICEACGGPGQPCCSFNECNNGGCCAPSADLTGMKCVAPGTSCSSTLDICAGGSCGSCGGLGQTCCDNIGCTAPSTTCADGEAGRQCEACGDLDQLCCSSRAEMCRAGLECSEISIFERSRCVQP
jgi:hypothetical protein